MSRLSDFSRAPEFPFRFQFRPIFSLGLAFSLFFATVPLVYAQEQSATAVSHRLKRSLSMPPRRWSRFTVSMSTARFPAPDSLLILQERFTRHTPLAVKREISQLNLTARNIQPASFWRISAAARRW